MNNGYHLKENKIRNNDVDYLMENFYAASTRQSKAEKVHLGY